jgi:AhpD family alkylhydroperoxidase
MARVAGVPADRAGVVARIAYRLSRRRYGQVMEPAEVYAHNSRVLATYAVFELMAERWKATDSILKELAVQRAAQTVGCSWCVDFGTFLGEREGVPSDKLRSVSGWRDSDAYDDTERLVLAYAEAMSATPMTVTDEQVAELRARLGEPALVELSAMIATENMRARINHALGLTSQGFCQVPVEVG